MVWTPHAAVERVRAWLRDRLIEIVRDERYGGVLVALVVGDQRAIADADWTLFNRTGIAHLVSISGLHITMIAALVGGIVGAMWRRIPGLLHRAPAQTVAIVAAVVAAFLYALLAGWGVPVGHPDPQVVERYAARGIQFLRTDQAGAAQWRFDSAGNAEFRPWRARAVRYWHNRPGAGRFEPSTDDGLGVPEEGELREPLFGAP